jgi:retron-type reverse transcriptase
MATRTRAPGGDSVSHDDQVILYRVLFWGLVVVIFIAIRAAARRRQQNRIDQLRRQQTNLHQPQRQPKPAAPAPTTAWPAGRSASAPAPSAAPAPAKPRPTSRTLNLDLSSSAFAPITDAEAKRLASGLGGALWANLWFGRRDRIPPADDPRTAIIDKAMVGQGLITPAELAEIHKVGEQMEALRGDLSTVHHEANRVVEQDREAKRQLKEQKKRESAERKLRHAEAVAHRRKTDIVYLGRGVSKGLADRRSHVEKLQSLGLPVLSTPADVAGALKVTVPRLRWLAYHSEATEILHYVRFTVPKKSGGVRELCAPHEDLAAAQEWILRNILDKVPVHNAAHGFVAGRSTVTNATPHVGAGVVINTDLTDFFPTITVHRVIGVFRQLGYSPAVSSVLALLCTEAPRRNVTYAGKPLFVASGPRALPQGACTSPMLSNLVARRMDSRLTGIATKLGFRYTRYADDLTFSAPSDEGKIGYLLARVRHITQDEGFAVNEAKTRILRPGDRQTVTGVVVNQRPGVPRDLVRRLRAILHRAQREGLTAQNREKRPHFEAWLRGMVAYVHMVNPKQGEPLRAALQNLR